MAANCSTGSKSSSSAAGKQSAQSAEQVVATFQRMRQEQRSMASKAAELEMDINEHSLVIETLKEVDPSRKCYRLVGGVLVERTVKEVLPALENNKEQVNLNKTKVTYLAQNSVTKRKTQFSFSLLTDLQSNRSHQYTDADERPRTDRVQGTLQHPAGRRRRGRGAVGSILQRQ
ncbi:Prefoldin subunit 2 [Oryzias melastigma]|uniref:Prefoldin subunit 2 n=1 Tax=Oryzias melastigma TaxID=30732 RepID=A0A834CEP2_ORYME|nr:Prefoldin subunit 2 [Oryzias melastigma]